MQIFVGNLSFAANNQDVKKLFEEFGNIDSTRVVMDKRGRKSRGFGFVTMANDRQAEAAITALNNKEFMGRPLNVSQAKPKPENTQIEFKPLERTGKYKEGRRSLSYIKRHTETVIKEKPKPSWKNGENPRRWRKKPSRKTYGSKNRAS